MTIIEKKINEIHEYENNPRHNENAVAAVANSIREFGFKVPIVIDKDGVIVAGHTRKKAAESLGMETVPCIVADDLTEEQIKAFRVADNKTAELAEWDIEKLEAELKQISDIDMSLFGFSEDGEEENEPDTLYTDKVDIPQYEVTGEDVSLADCVNDDKTALLAEEIQNSSVTDAEKEFLIKAAQRHTAFNYQKIAEYYASASPEMQKLMEKSALVIIDFENAIANGYAMLKKEIDLMWEVDGGAE